MALILSIWWHSDTTIKFREFTTISLLALDFDEAIWRAEPSSSFYIAQSFSSCLLLKSHHHAPFVATNSTRLFQGTEYRSYMSSESLNMHLWQLHFCHKFDQSPRRSQLSKRFNRSLFSMGSGAKIYSRFHLFHQFILHDVLVIQFGNFFFVSTFAVLLNRKQANTMKCFPL